MGFRKQIVISESKELIPSELEARVDMLAAGNLGCSFGAGAGGVLIVPTSLVLDTIVRESAMGKLENDHLLVFPDARLGEGTQW